MQKNEVVKLMRKELDPDKMIREQVKVEMNRFLWEILKNVCQQLNEYPYTTIDYEMLKEATYHYRNIERINEEKKKNPNAFGCNQSRLRCTVNGC